MKIIRLDSSELREWRANTSHLVDAEGHLVARLDRPLENALGTVLRTARSQRKTVEQRVAIGKREHLITVTVTRPGIDPSEITFTPNIDGHRVVTGRQVVAARMLQKNGECQLRGPNGIILKVVRDPGVHRPTFQESLQVAPRPEHCPCRHWGKSHPGTHYPTCPYNRLAPPDEQAMTTTVPEEEARLLPTEAFESLRALPVKTPATSPVAAKVDPRAVVVEASSIDSPDACRNGCLDWATPQNHPIPAGQHHPTCVFARDWAIKTARETPRWLVDLRNGERVRMASNEEIGESEITARKTGSPLLHIDGVPYAVVLETELAEELHLSTDPVVPAVEAPLPAAEPGVARSVSP